MHLTIIWCCSLSTHEQCQLKGAKQRLHLRLSFPWCPLELKEHSKSQWIHWIPQVATQQSGLMSSVGLGPVILRSSLSICMGAYRLPANELSIPLGLGSFIQDSTYDNGWGIPALEELKLLLRQPNKHTKVKVKVAHLSRTLCNCTVHGILQARILDWAAFPFSRGFSQPRNQSRVSCIAGRFFTNWALREAQHHSSLGKWKSEPWWYTTSLSLG